MFLGSLLTIILCYFGVRFAHCTFFGPLWDRSIFFQLGVSYCTYATERHSISLFPYTNWTYLRGKAQPQARGLRDTVCSIRVWKQRYDDNSVVYILLLDLSQYQSLEHNAFCNTFYTLFTFLKTIF